MLYNSFFDLISKGGYTVLVLLICSILSLKVVIEKAISFQSIKDKYIDDFKLRIIEAINTGDLKEATFVCRMTTYKFLFFTVKSPLTNVFRFIIENTRLSKEELTETALNKLDKELIKMEKGLGILSTLGSISPFIGLFGTVIGIIRSFEALSVNQASSYLGVMSGIAEALVSTAAGLLVAVPAVLFYNYFTRRIRLAMPAFDEAIADVIRNLKSQKKEILNAPTQNR